ncbi:MAG: multifunctional CCA addition/repair protein [Cellvibrionaceae bacterium]
MDTYLVGGAVRDEMLGHPFHERDWVVVGSSPKEMTENGFKSVGKDFPVFLHPETQEEYALARTERKTSGGYTGFSFHAAPDVTLEEDLIRRDLTINAIAKDADGNIIDPYHGQTDIENRILRHVSNSFCEDPVRILRTARFAARYHHLGFSIAGETHALMKTMVDNGEVDYLVPERVWKEMSRALAEKNPDVFFEVLKVCGALARLMPEINNLFGIPQRPEHHPEIDCGIHSLMVLQQATLLSQKSEVRFASLVHDLGKATTPADVLPQHIGHEHRSIDLVKQLCERLAVPNEFRNLGLMAAQYHTHCHRAKELTPKKILETLNALDAFRRPDRFADFLLCCEADAKGRTGFEDRDYPQAEYFQNALDICEKITAAQVDRSKHQGKAIGEEIHRLRISALKAYKQENLLTQTKKK